MSKKDSQFERLRLFDRKWPSCSFGSTICFGWWIFSIRAKVEYLLLGMLENDWIGFVEAWTLVRQVVPESSDFRQWFFSH